MDEQHHRRRRQQPQDAEKPRVAHPVSSPAGDEQPAIEQAHHDASSHQEAHPHRRRRRTAEHERGEAQPSDLNAPQISDDDVFWHPESERLDQAQPEREEEKKNPLGALAALDAFVCRIGDFCLSAIQWIGVGLLFAAGFAASGLSRLFAKVKPVLSSTKVKAARAAVHTGKRVRRAKPSESQTGEVTLEPTRPQDYRGMGNKRVVRAPKKKVSVFYSAAMAGLICVALVSAYMVLSILWRSISTKRLSESLSERYNQLSEGAQTTQQEESRFEDSAIEGELVVFSPGETPAPAMTAEETDAAPQAEATDEPAAEPTEKPKDAVKSTKFHQVGGDALPEMEALYQENRDLIGWLQMEEILDLPVVYKDNEYYLTRDFYKNKSASGTLFLDENHPFRENAQNLLLHGHNMKDGTMFGRLVQYETNLQFLKNNPFIQYSTLWKKEQYVIFAVLHVSLDTRSEDFFNYFTHHTFSSDTQFENYVRSLQNRSVFSIPIDVEPSDALLTLSTCLDDDRLVIVARRLREGESKSTLRHLVQLAARQ